ncbi:MAG: hypothetical protein WBK88_07120 [Methanothrix sp.]
METKRCSKCGEEKPVDAFYRNRAAKDGLQNLCKQCHREYMRRWNQSNRERVTALARKWRRENPERARYHNERKETKRFIKTIPRGECYLEKARRLLWGEVVDPHCAGGEE